MESSVVGSAFDNVPSGRVGGWERGREEHELKYTAVSRSISGQRQRRRDQLQLHQLNTCCRNQESSGFFYHI